MASASLKLITGDADTTLVSESKSDGVARCLASTSLVATPPPQPLTDDDAARARRIYSDRGGPPSDQPEASMCLQTELVQAWRFRHHSGRFDGFVQEFVVPLGLETYAAMMSSGAGSARADTLVLKTCEPKLGEKTHRTVAYCYGPTH